MHSVSYVLVITLGATLCCPSLAASTSATIPISTDVDAICTLATTSINFGLIDGASKATANGSIVVNCPNQTSYNVTIDAGQHYNSSWRTMFNGSQNIQYGLYHDTAYTRQSGEWGDSGFAGTYSYGVAASGVGTGTEQTFIVYGRTESVGSLVPGDYSDTVTVSVHF